jgi:hypothetical protein
VDGKRAAEWQAPDSLSPRKAGPAGLRIEAYSERGVTGGGDGDIAMPAIYTRALRAWPSAALKRPTWVTRRLPPSGRSTRNAARAWRTPPATGAMARS